MIGSGGDIVSGDMFGLIVMYFLIDYIVVMMVMGFLLIWYLNGVGMFSGFGELGIVWVWSLVIIFNYYFGQLNVWFRLYLGVGVIYMWFSNIKFSNFVFIGQIYFLLIVGIVFEGLIFVLFSYFFVFVVNGGLMYNIDLYWLINVLVVYLWVLICVMFIIWFFVGMVMSISKFWVNLIVMFLLVGYCF